MRIVVATCLLGLWCPSFLLAEELEGVEQINVEFEFAEPPNVTPEEDWWLDADITWRVKGTTPASGVETVLGGMLVYEETANTYFDLNFEGMLEGDFWSVSAEIPLQLIENWDGSKKAVVKTYKRTFVRRLGTNDMTSFQIQLGSLQVFPYDPANPPPPINEKDDIEQVESLRFLNGAMRLLKGLNKHFNQ